jgi:hypothetical protein
LPGFSPFGAPPSGGFPGASPLGASPSGGFPGASPFGASPLAGVSVASTVVSAETSSVPQAETAKHIAVIIPIDKTFLMSLLFIRTLLVVCYEVIMRREPKNNLKNFIRKNVVSLYNCVKCIL